MLDKLKEIFRSRINSLEIFYLLNDLKQVYRGCYHDHELPKIKEFCNINHLYVSESPFKIIFQDREKIYSDKGLLIKSSEISGISENQEKAMNIIYISKDEKKAELANLYELRKDHLNLGIALGYPRCCIDFFIRNNEKAKDKDFYSLTVKYSKGKEFPFQNNLFLREKDISLLSHFPCSLNCKYSKKIADKRIELLKKHINTALFNDLKGNFKRIRFI